MILSYQFMAQLTLISNYLINGVTKPIKIINIEPSQPNKSITH